MNATEFEMAFESERHSKEHWNEQQTQLDPNIYGWATHADDHHCNGPI